MKITSTVEEFSQIGIGFPKGKHIKKDKTSEWIEIRKDLTELFDKLGINYCEAGFTGCTYQLYLGFAHADKRIHLTEKQLKTEVIRICTNCHQKIEYIPRPVMRAYVEKMIETRLIDQHKLELLETGGKK